MTKQTVIVTGDQAEWERRWRLIWHSGAGML